MERYKCEECEVEENLPRSNCSFGSIPVCRSCGSTLVPVLSQVSDTEVDGTQRSERILLDNLFHQTLELVGADLRNMITATMQQSAPSRQISMSYLKTLGKVDVDSSKAILRDTYLSIGPLKILAVAASFGRLPEGSIEINGALVAANPIDGSGALSNAEECKGAIVVLQRGTVSFARKSIQAITAGAQAVVIIQTVDVWPFLMTDSGAEFAAFTTSSAGPGELNYTLPDNAVANARNSTLSDDAAVDADVPIVPVVMIGKADADVVMRMMQDKSSQLVSASLRIGSCTQECAICQEDFAERDSVLKLPCRHLYHCGCVTSWLEQISTCPLCRLQLPKVTTTEEKLSIDRTRARNFLNSTTSTYYN